jgi:hypothetical protein
VEGSDEETINRLVDKYKEYGGTVKEVKDYIGRKDIFSGVKKLDEKEIKKFLEGEEGIVESRSGENVFVKDLLDESEVKILKFAIELQEEVLGNKSELIEKLKE